MTQVNHLDIILAPWEQALEDASSISLGRDPYGVVDLAKAAKQEGITYIQIPVSKWLLNRIHQKAEARNITTTILLSEVVEQI